MFWLMPRRGRPLLLLAASYYFYMSWLKSYGVLLFALTAANFLLGLALSRLSAERKRRIVLVAGIALNLGCLALYKYTNFILESAWAVLTAYATHVQALDGLPAQAPALPIVLPLGISFFVFEFIHYLTDVYRGSRPILGPVRFGLFAAFFPSQIAGPIKRYQDFDAQVEERKPFDGRLFQAGLWLILIGMFKKVVIGDNFACVVDRGFSSVQALSTVDAWVLALSFAMQIYYDFSGYTDIGRGSAMLFGFRLPQNFNMPYLAANLSDFWRRWHMSLSTWLRDYLYIPLGGSRGGPVSTARNLIVTMLLGGLWHGASWHFVAWGAYHGIGLAATHAWQKLCGSLPRLSRLRGTLAWSIAGRLLTFAVVVLGWVLFRASSLPEAMAVYGGMFSQRAGSLEPLALTFWQSSLPAALVFYAVCFLSWHAWRRLKLVVSRRSPGRFNIAAWLTPTMPARLVAYLASSFLVAAFAASRSVPFIYFQF